MENKLFGAGADMEVENEDAVVGTAVGTIDQGVSTSEKGEPIEAEDIEEIEKSFVSRHSASLTSGGDGGTSSSAVEQIGAGRLSALGENILEPEVDSRRSGESNEGGEDGDRSRSEDVDANTLEVLSRIYLVYTLKSLYLFIILQYHVPRRYYHRATVLLIAPAGYKFHVYRL